MLSILDGHCRHAHVGALRGDAVAPSILGMNKSGYVRLAHPKTRLEAVTSRPKWPSAVGRMTRHAGQNKIWLTITHEAAAQIKRLVANGRAGLRHIQETAPQLEKARRWCALVRYIAQRILASQLKPNPSPPALQSG
jgi:hypothetical protein